MWTLFNLNLSIPGEPDPPTMIPFVSVGVDNRGVRVNAGIDPAVVSISNIDAYVPDGRSSVRVQ